LDSLDGGNFITKEDKMAKYEINMNVRTGNSYDNVTTVIDTQTGESSARRLAEAQYPSSKVDIRTCRRID
jgi:hypothetical protein